MESIRHGFTFGHRRQPRLLCAAKSYANRSCLTHALSASRALLGLWGGDTVYTHAQGTRQRISWFARTYTRPHAHI